MKETCESEDKPNTIKEMIRSAYFWKPVSAVIIGGIVGFVYYHFIGCASGSCGITSNPFSSVLMGSAVGYFIVNSPCKTC
jgi:hypothetical protein